MGLDTTRSRLWGSALGAATQLYGRRSLNWQRCPHSMPLCWMQALVLVNRLDTRAHPLNNKWTESTWFDCRTSGHWWLHSRRSASQMDLPRTKLCFSPGNCCIHGSVDLFTQWLGCRNRALSVGLWKALGLYSRLAFQSRDSTWPAWILTQPSCLDYHKMQLAKSKFGHTKVGKCLVGKLRRFELRVSSTTSLTEGSACSSNKFVSKSTTQTKNLFALSK